MAQPLMRVTARRITGTAVAVAAVAVIGLWMLSRYLALHDTGFFSGWLLGGMCVFLALYNLRKKLTYPPLLRSAMWLQLHVYVGLISIAVFLMHTGFVRPTGGFDTILYVLYAATALSGVLGLYITRVFPPFLTQRGNEVIFERIPVLRRELREKAEELVLASVEKADTTTLADFYSQRLAAFFDAPRNYWFHIFESRVPIKRLLSDLDKLDRYLSDSERGIASELSEVIEAKDTLDYHWAVQGTLKGWLFVHIPLTYMLLIFVAAHVVVMHAFDGGTP